MLFERIYDTSLAQASYFIGCQAKGEAMVIDAKRDVDSYLALAEENNMTITHIAETHIHADFLSGSRELAEVTGGGLYLSDEGGADWQYEYPHHGLLHGELIKVGNISFEVIHTPGHTPESICFLLRDHAATDSPVMVFTGDFVFVGDVGRPDLLENVSGKDFSQKAAKALHQSLDKFRDLPSFVQVWPGHGAGSACGKNLGAVPVSTVGYELITNWAFQYKTDEKGFIQSLFDGQPEPPKYFDTMKKLNKVDRPLLVEVPVFPLLDKKQFLNAYKNGLKIIDTRDKRVFGEGFVPGSINIQAKDYFTTWAGWLIDYKEQIVLVADEKQVEGLARKLMRIGLDNVLGYVSGVDSLGLDLRKREMISTDELKQKIGEESLQILDVRSTKEFTAGHIQGADHLFLGTLVDNLDKVDKHKEKVVHCQTGDRASIAYSLLLALGVDNIKIYEGGIKEWVEKENPLEQT